MSTNERFVTALFLTVALLALAGCGQPWDFYGETPRYGIDVQTHEGMLLTPQDKDRLAKFFADLDPYTEALLNALTATGTVRPIVWDEPNRSAVLDRVLIRIETPEAFNAAGIFMPIFSMALRIDQNLLATYGHELVRLVMYQQDHREAFVPSSWDRSRTLIGRWWDIADNIAALEFAE